MKALTARPSQQASIQIDENTPMDRLVWIARAFLSEYKLSILGNRPLCSAKCPRICDCDRVASLGKGDLIVLAQLIIKGEAAMPNGGLSEHVNHLIAPIINQCRSTNGI
ncbi:MAG: hypothetical protein PHO91_02445 [Patescibacteria group bacterium]|nr:hypothetical protein [Patescibacteria group bacterium]